ncbi:MAG: cobyric acid synthase, partial [Chloroflexi bacterium]|nr:cobyric acid synthase [Chloroflexota bacterium]
DIANMRVARAAESPVLLVADIDRGGVFAALYGTVALLPEEERSLVRGMIVNKFRGDPTILEPGLRELERLTSVPVLGVIPYLSHLAIPEEDSVSLEGRSAVAPTTGLDVSVIRVQRLANSNDFEALEQEPGVSVRYVRRLEDLGSPDLVVLPGSKSTVADLRVLRGSGLADGVVRLARAGTPVIGICGGYQMLGRLIRDPGRVESEEDEVEGLGLLDVVTEFDREKSTHLVRGRVLDGTGILGGASGQVVEGYEIHMGRTHRLGARPLIQIAERGGSSVRDLDGAADADGHIAGTYLHGLFDNPSARGAILAYLARRRGLAWPAAGRASEGLEEAFGRLAAAVGGALDMTTLRERCGVA